MSTNQKNITCPLCLVQGAKYLTQDRIREYYICKECDLRFVPKKFHLNPEIEKQRYDYHENDPQDQGYRNFLGQLLTPLTGYLKKEYSGIDFGSGPTGAISVILGETDFKVSNYDPFYSNTPELLNKKYDFITCTEVAEHFCDPKKDWEILLNLAKKGSYIGIMTSLYDKNIDFLKWSYINDDTHICFYSDTTINYISENYGLEVLYKKSPAVIFKKR